MAQYDAAPAAGEAGLIYDLSTKDIKSMVAEGALSFGRAVVQGTSDDQCKVPVAASSARDFQGISVRTHALQAVRSLSGEDAYSDEEMVNVLTSGRIWVVVEAAPSKSDRVYFRATTGGAEVAGSFRGDGDGTAQVTTITPTAVNATEYRMQLQLDDGRSFEFTFTSDGSATATEIVTGLNALVAAEAELDGLIVGSGTTTMILTADAGVGFQVTSSDSPGTLAVALTTPLASDCVFLPNAKWHKVGSSVAVVELS